MFHGGNIALLGIHARQPLPSIGTRFVFSALTIKAFYGPRNVRDLVQNDGNDSRAASIFPP